MVLDSIDVFADRCYDPGNFDSPCCKRCTRLERSRKTCSARRFRVLLYCASPAACAARISKTFRQSVVLVHALFEQALRRVKLLAKGLVILEMAARFRLADPVSGAFAIPGGDDLGGQGACLCDSLSTSRTSDSNCCRTFSISWVFSRTISSRRCSKPIFRDRSVSRFAESPAELARSCSRAACKVSSSAESCSRD